jgi:RNA polymerase sigma factor (sigma-70 family)
VTQSQAGPAEVFEMHRGRLTAVAHRVLGSHADAEDAVQETWLRFSSQDVDAIDNPAGWLTTVVGRICIDRLRARTARREVSNDDDFPDLVVSDAAISPEDEAMLADSVGAALLVVLDTLAPAERMAFVLHDVFGMPFDEIGPIVDRSPDAAKMLASRARRKVQGSHPPPGALRADREVVDAFLAAARDGDFDRLLEVLDPAVVWRTQTAHGIVVLRGADQVASRARQASYAKATAAAVTVNGRPGITAWSPAGKPRGVMMCTVVGGRIVEITSVIDPERLARLDLSRPPDGSRTIPR